MIRYLFVFLFSCAFACTDFVVQAKDGSLVNGRSLEFALEFNSILKVFPRNQRLQSRGPGNKNGVSWTSKYGYLGINGLGMDFSFDGMNEVGLTFGYLWLPGITEFPKISPNEMKNTLDFTDFCAWALGNFKTVKEVKEALETIHIWGHPVQPLGAAPVHAALHDTEGNSIVVEFVGGEMQVYDNPMSVMTNSPAFDWHLSNLENYLNLSPYNPSPITFKGEKMEALGQGFGSLGLPGDFTPPSRFIKIATFLRFAAPLKNGTEAVNLAEHLLNSVDIPLGVVRNPNQDTGDFTQWVVIKDMSQKLFYFRSYYDQALKVIDMKKLNFNRQMNQSIPIATKKGYFDVTDSLKKRESITVFSEVKSWK